MVRKEGKDDAGQSRKRQLQLPAALPLVRKRSVSIPRQQVCLSIQMLAVLEDMHRCVRAKRAMHR
jgi:hypothetical protein